MIFDQMAEMVEKWCPQFSPVLNAATVIHLDGIPHRFLAKSMAPADLYRLTQQFRLPGASGIAAIEDRGGCVLLADQPHGDRFGINVPRLFMDCIRGDASSDMDAYNDPDDAARENLAVVNLQPAGTMILTVGVIHPQTQGPRGWQVAGHINHIYLGTLQKLQHDPDVLADDSNPAYSALTRAALKNAMTALEEIAHIEAMPLFNGWPPPPESPPDPPPAPEVGTTPPAEWASGRHVRRSHERPIWNVQDTGRIEVTVVPR